MTTKTLLKEIKTITDLEELKDNLIERFDIELDDDGKIKEDIDMVVVFIKKN